MATLTDRFRAAKRAFLDPTELQDARARVKAIDRMLEAENNRNLDLLHEREILRRELTAANTTSLLYEAAGLAIPEEFCAPDRTLAGRIDLIVDALNECRSQLAPIVTPDELENYDPDFGYFEGEEPERELPRIVIPDEKPRKAPRKSSKTTSKRTAKKAPKGKKAKK